MKWLLAVLIALIASSCANMPDDSQPLADGHYVFIHKFAEHPNMDSITLSARIEGRHITLTNNEQSNVFPKGVIEEGTLMWHTAQGQWIIGHDDSDRFATEAGGCSDGPEVVDLKLRVYWTC